MRPAARFPPTSSGASGAKPHPDVSRPCRPSTTTNIGRKPPHKGGGPTNRARRGRVNHEVSDGPAPGFRPRRPSSGGPTAPTKTRPRSRQAGFPSIKGPVPTGTQEDDVGPYVPSCRGPEVWRGEDVRSRLAPYRCAPVLERQPALAQHHQPTAPPPDLKGQCRPTPRHRRRCRSPERTCIRIEVEALAPEPL